MSRSRVMTRKKEPAGTGRGGVSIVGGWQGQGAEREEGVRGHCLPSPSCLSENLLMYFRYLS